MGFWTTLLQSSRVKEEKEKQRKAGLILEANSWADSVKQNKSLPKISSNLMLKSGEFAILETPSELFETRSVRRSIGAGSGFRLMKGLTVGGYSSQSESHQEWRKIDDGKLILTNKRMIFDGNKENRDIPLAKIMSVSNSLDSLQISLESKAKDLFFSVPNAYIWRACLHLIQQVSDPFNLEGVNMSFEFN